ncbi:MAG TPA: 50S ribosomal protein L11 methyltransferase [Gemmatimonadaceae bacterium]|jgi:protein arginine N-methyltransferase 1
MFADEPRTAAYMSAIQRAVRPGSTVVEIGTGVGYFAVAACRAGARRVYAIELNPAIELAMQLAADNGCVDRITFIRDDSRRVTLAEQGDVLLSDLRGVLPLFQEHIPTIVDARTRLVRPGAALVPHSDTLWVAPCTAPQEWGRDHADAGHSLHGIDRRAIAARVRSDWYRCRLSAADLVGTAARWATLDYSKIDSPNVAGGAEWTFSHDAVADGLAIWFEGDFGFGVALSNSPLAPRTLYGQAFFPFERQLHAKTGDRLTTALSAHCINGEYLWGWDSTLTPSAPGSESVSFRQSTLASHIVSLGRLRELSAEGAAFPPTRSTG